MAQKVTVTRISDLDGQSPGAHTVELGLDGIAYEIDLVEQEHQELVSRLRPYVDAARKVSSKRGLKGRRQTTPSGLTRTEREQLRNWAQAHGVSLGERGRLPEDVIAAWRAGDVSLVPAKWRQEAALV
jgi:Lsr2